MTTLCGLRRLAARGSSLENISRTGAVVLCRPRVRHPICRRPTLNRGKKFRREEFVFTELH